MNRFQRQLIGLIVIPALFTGRCTSRLEAQTPDGQILPINTGRLGRQNGPLVSLDGAGRALVLWTDFNQEPNNGLAHPRIMGRGFSPQGLPRSSDSVYNASPYIADGVSGISAQGNGQFMALWAERFSYLGRPYQVGSDTLGSIHLLDDPGPEFLKNDYPIGFGTGVGGEFVGVWQREPTNQSPVIRSTFARWFDRNAEPATDEIPFADAFQGEGTRPIVDVVAGPDRSVLIGWSVPGFNEAYWDIHIQAYSSTGAKLGPEFLYPHNIGYPTAGMAWNPLTGRFVVAWRSFEVHDSNVSERILLQSLSLEGQPLTAQPVVVSDTGEFRLSWPATSEGTALSPGFASTLES